MKLCENRLHATAQRRDENLETGKQFSCLTHKLFASAFRCVVAALREIGLDSIGSALGLGTDWISRSSVSGLATSVRYFFPSAASSFSR